MASEYPPRDSTLQRIKAWPTAVACGMTHQRLIQLSPAILGGRCAEIGLSNGLIRGLGSGRIWLGVDIPRSGLVRHLQSPCVHRVLSVGSGGRGGVEPGAVHVWHGACVDASADTCLQTPTQQMVKIGCKDVGQPQFGCTRGTKKGAVERQRSSTRACPHACMHVHPERETHESTVAAACSISPTPADSPLLCMSRGRPPLPDATPNAKADMLPHEIMLNAGLACPSTPPLA